MEKPYCSLDNLILGPDSRGRIGKSVKESVSLADAAGLPPAYEPAFSRLNTFRDEQSKSRDELLRLRREARAEKAERDNATLEFHRKVFDLLAEGGQPAHFIMRKAIEMIQLWEDKGLNGMYSPIWKQLLEGSQGSARDFILSDNESGWPLALRSASPFTHIGANPEDEWDREGGAVRK